ncbi:hypothetical protein C8N46_101686 [Kordia periserrulae]|uniref:Polymer-forming protein n=1 Tax=Kordia periserrulae TaxID=701523 RepID=A0A2T6C717_9FLAO|nr:hypothetical protein [Kordia periserrulae]PTX64076.1 hypothetical protein C8N46_101686 [Kordia periserrulae]
MILQKLKASSLLQAVFVCFLIATLCFGIILLSSYNSLFQKRILQKTQLQLTNDAAITLLLSDAANITNGSTQMSVFSNQVNTNTNIKDWGFYKVISAKTYYNKDTIRKSILVGKTAKSTTALYVTNYDKIVNVAGTVTITGDVFVPKGLLEKRNLFGEQTTITIQGAQKEAENQLPKLRAINTNCIPESAANLSEEQLEKESIYVRSFDKETQVCHTNNLSFLEGKIVKGNIIFQSNGTLILNKHMQLEDVIINARNVVIQSGFKGTVQIIASSSVVVEDDVKLSYPSSILVQHPSNVTNVTIGKESVIIGGIIVNNSTHNKVLESVISIGEDALIVGAVYCYGTLELKGNVYGSVFADRLLTKTKETSYANLLMDAEIDVSKLPENFIGIPLFETTHNDKNMYETVKEL